MRWIEKKAEMLQLVKRENDYVLMMATLFKDAALERESQFSRECSF
jgi:hypothetical protein